MPDNYVSDLKLSDRKTKIFFGLILVLSLCWFVYAGGIASYHVYHCTDAWLDIASIEVALEGHSVKPSACLSLNEFGDYLAGSFAPLAFLWLMIAVLIQSAELGAQKIALIAQLDEARQQTSLLIAEQAVSKARTQHDKMLALFRIVRSVLQNIGHYNNLEIDDITFLTQSCSGKADYINNAIEMKMMGRGLERDYNQTLVRSETLLPHLNDIRDLSARLSSHDLKLFEACGMVRLIEVLGRLETSGVLGEVGNN